MSDRVVHRLVGYDRRTERVAAQYDVPPNKLPVAKAIALVNTEDDPYAYASYPLDLFQSRTMGDFIGLVIEAEKFDFFLEAFADPRETRKRA